MRLLLDTHTLIWWLSDDDYGGYRMTTGLGHGRGC